MSHTPLKTSKVITWLTGLLSIVVFLIAAQIEILNARAGGMMPIREAGKWRASLLVDEASWRQLAGPRDEQGEPVARALTDEEKVAMDADIKWSIANNQLRDFVVMPGLLQYALVPVLLIVAGIQIKQHLGKGYAWLLGSGGILIALVAGSLMFYRAYLPSLGY